MLAFLVLPGSAAAMTPEDATCRAQIQQRSAKLATIALKKIYYCLVTRIKTGQDMDCYDLDVADPTGDIAVAENKLRAYLQSKCAAGPFVTADVLAQFPKCPSPADADVQF